MTGLYFIHFIATFKAVQSTNYLMCILIMVWLNLSLSYYLICIY